MPRDNLSFSDKIRWVVVVGWVTIDFVSPKLLEISNIFNLLINLNASFFFPLILKLKIVPPRVCCFLAREYWENLIRLSIGLETVSDLKKDILAALK